MSIVIKLQIERGVFEKNHGFLVNKAIEVEDDPILEDSEEEGGGSALTADSQEQREILLENFLEFMQSDEFNKSLISGFFEYMKIDNPEIEKKQNSIQGKVGNS